MGKLWETRFTLSDFDASGIPFPTESLDFSPSLRLVKRDEDCVACFAVKGDDPLFESCEERISRIISVYALVSGFSATTKLDGASGISGLEDLGNPKRPHVKISVTAEYRPEQTERHTSRLLNNWRKTARIWKLLEHALDEKMFLRLALAYYYQSGLSSIRREEAFIDAAIGLEAMFNDGPQDIKYKLAVRGALVLSCSDHPDAKDAFKSLRDLYDKRNHLVHGQPSKKVEVHHQDLVLIRRLLHGSLRACVPLGLSMTKLEISQLVDQALIDHQALRQLKADMTKGLMILEL